MCGIAVIISGVRIDLSALSCTILEESSLPQSVESFSIEEIKEALHRRGPDSLGSKKVHLKMNGDDVLSKIEEFENEIAENSFLANGDCSNVVGEMCFIGATLQLRGVNPVTQLMVDSLENLLVYNGEIFGGVDVDSESNDGEVLLECLKNCLDVHTLQNCTFTGGDHKSIPELLSTIKGPWALAYWQSRSKTLWFGRDAFGRRSLLVHWPTLEDNRFLISSVGPRSSAPLCSDVKDGNNKKGFWEELPCGVYSMHYAKSKSHNYITGKVKRHEWTSPMLIELMKWDRSFVDPRPCDFTPSNSLMPAQKVLDALREAVMKRTIGSIIFQAATGDVQKGEQVPVAVLFSGGLDSMILAALLDKCLDPRYAIDLLNVSFDRDSAPDRVSAKAGIKELKQISPLRRWKLVEIDAELSKLAAETSQVVSLINPAKTYMDLNIGIALWLASGGEGFLFGGDSDSLVRTKYKSEARILLVGAGADEQCAGYGRHRTSFRNKGWLGLNEEMKLDMQRIWKRNLGRDDRCIADNGKEARFPFLDEDVIRTLLDLPLWIVADLNQPSGVGDKKILREVAQLLGINQAARLPKRAIQFGSRIARESNRKNFGSNRAANQASAGSAPISKSAK